MSSEIEKYEISFLLSEDSSVKDCTNILELAGAKIIRENDLGVRKLAYPIVKITSARLYAVIFEMLKTDLPKLEKALRLDKTIIRYLIIKELRVSIPKPAKEGSTEDTEKKIDKKAEAKTEEVPVEKKEVVKEVAPEIKEEDRVVETEKKVEEVKKTTEVVEKAEKAEKKTEKKTEEKPKRRKIQKPVKIAADQLDKKLEELTLD